MLQILRQLFNLFVRQQHLKDQSIILKIEEQQIGQLSTLTSPHLQPRSVRGKWFLFRADGAIDAWRHESNCMLVVSALVCEVATVT